LPDLDFEQTRLDLRDRIEVPGYAAVRSRARVLRRRRSIGTVGAALACLLALATGTVLSHGRGGAGPDQIAASADALPSGAVWRSGPITLLGLNGPVLDVPGDVRDVQFADPDHGYALSARCERGAGQPCDLALAASTDGGRTWHNWNLPITQAPADRLPHLITLGPTGIVLSGESTWFGRYGQGGWQSVSTVSTVDTVDTGRLWVTPIAGPTDTGTASCGAQVVQVWRDNGLARLAAQPNLNVCWVSPVPAADGAWWVGGIADGAPAVAVSRDSGRTWQKFGLAGPTGAWAQVSLLGSDAYAAVVTARGGNPYPETLSIQGMFRSAAGGPFVAYGQRIGTLIGDVVPLLDGRLLTAGPNWYLTSGRGAELAPAGSSLPWVYRLQATPGGWVALDLFDNGWSAVSHDGENWQKINVR
jgi:hypothetical protein